VSQNSRKNPFEVLEKWLCPAEFSDYSWKIVPYIYTYLWGDRKGKDQRHNMFKNAGFEQSKWSEKEKLGCDQSPTICKSAQPYFVSKYYYML
jgi:hypothetical protein